MSHPALWTCPACGRPLTVALNPEGGEAGTHRPLEISRASAAAHACAPAARFPQFHSASSSSITGYEPASCQPWQPPVSAGAEDDEGVLSQSEYTLTKPSSCPNHRDHVTHRRAVVYFCSAVLTRVGKSMERLLTAYQEDLLSLEQLRERMPLLRQREQTLRYELNALVEQTRERAAHLRLAETLSAFLTRLRATAETLDIVERQRIVRLIVKEVLVNDDKIVIRHCIPVPSGPPPTNGGGPNNDADNAADPRSYLLRSGSKFTAVQQRLHASLHSGLEGNGLRPALRGGNRQLRRRLCATKARKGGRDGHLAAAMLHEG